MSIYKLYPTDDTCINKEAVDMCLFYKNSYLRLKRWFGYSYDFWLCDMNEELLLKNILRMVVPKTMYMLFINIAIKIRKKFSRQYDILNKYKIDNPDLNKQQTRKYYYNANIEKLKTYSKNHYLLRNSRINIFRKNI